MKLSKRFWARWSFIMLALASALLWSCATRPINDTVQRGAVYKEGKFVSPWGQIDKSFMDFLKWQFEREKPEWPEWVENETFDALPTLSESFSITYINHATLLIRMNGIAILTDPIYSERVGPLGLFGPKRVHAPGVAFDELPPIDVVVVSHNHYDHLDLDTIKKLHMRDHPQILVGLGNETLLESEGITHVRPMDWGESVFVKGVKIIFAPSQHWSARGLLDRNKTLWGSFVLMDKVHRVYFAGDTGYTDHFAQIGQNYGPFDVALLPIGAYEPRWFMQEQHINPSEAIKAKSDLNANHAIGMHFDTFQLADDVYGQAGALFLTEAQKTGESVSVLKPGETWVN